ncbi:MAG TPA: FAD-dependent oxidoreductase [Gammaproteobacteria bacterium]|nr:FAD-dependent oxidoreductase [Gammaproteobacteria bacterium]
MTKLNTRWIDYQTLRSDEGLQVLDSKFEEYLHAINPSLLDQLQGYQQQPDYSADSVLSLAPYLDDFIAKLFNIENEVEALQQTYLQEHPIAKFKKELVLKRARRLMTKMDGAPSQQSLDVWIESFISKNCLDHELTIAMQAVKWIDSNHEENLEKLSYWASYQLLASKEKQLKWVSFNIPQRHNPEGWVEYKNDQGLLKGVTQRLRQGFSLTDQRMDARSVANEIHYCVYCHSKEGDFCRTGFPVKKSEPPQGLKTDAHGRVLTGCPLDEKISEMNILKREGLAIASLAVIMIDNPMCAATGHRICNDCMKSCIYQKQDPVNIPQVETKVLTDVLALPWGVEIYALLMRWLPLRLSQPKPKPKIDKNVCVMGMGPAGFTLAYYLLMEGCSVVGMDGLKVEPLPQQWVDEPIQDYQQLWKDLDQRSIVGFGGVAEYGITARWDKNFLTLIYLGLLRWDRFRVYGGVRFGGTVTVESIQKMGFDHLSLAVGAGLPNAINIPGSMAPGMMQANDFLMNLQLTGAVRSDSMIPLQVNLPAVVIGGGLTGVDAATEVQAYYVEMVKRVYRRYQSMDMPEKEKNFWAQFDEKDRRQIKTWVEHGHRICQSEGSGESIQDCIDSWGGVTIVYRRRLQESPAYRLNPEELEEALKEGVNYLENHSPKALELNEFGEVAALQVVNHQGVEKNIKASTVLVATGAKPNVAYSFEHQGTFIKQNGYYLPHVCQDNTLTTMVDVDHCKQGPVGVFTNYSKKGFKVSFLGDAHAVYHGSVVKAIASAKNHYLDIVASLPRQTSHETQGLLTQLDDMFNIVLIANQPFVDNLRSLRCKIPHAKHNFLPGQFYRIQPFEFDAPQGRSFESLSVWVLNVDEEAQEMVFVVPQVSAAEQAVKFWEEGSKLAVMGPTGVRFKIPQTPGKILLMVDAFSVHKVMHLAQCMHDAKHEVYVVSTESLNQGVLDILEPFVKEVVITNSVEDALLVVSQKDIFRTVAYVYLCAYGETIKLLGQQQKRLRSCLAPNCEIKASVHGPMQCMLKGICAQCVQWQLDPETGQRTKAVFACSWQDQPIELVDWQHYTERLKLGKSLDNFNQFYRKWVLEN